MPKPEFVFPRQDNTGTRASMFSKTITFVFGENKYGDHRASVSLAWMQTEF